MDPSPPHSPVERCFDLICRIGLALAGTALVVLVAIFGWLVFGRYVLNATPTWVEQLGRVLIVYITFVGAAVGIRDNAHLSVDFIRDSLPPALRTACVLIANGLMAGFAAVMAWQSSRLVAFGMDTTIPLLDIPEGVRSAAMVVFGVLVFLFSAAAVWRAALALMSTGERPDAAGTVMKIEE